mgnify:CR=1 FL=1
MEIFKNIMLVLLGMLLAVCIFCVTVAIGCAVNGISFGQQISQWFGEVAPAIEQTAETTAHISVF